MKKMKQWKKYGAFMCAMVMCLSLAACGSADSTPTSSAETENAESDGEEMVTDAASLDGMWSINGGTKLYFDSEDGYYIYRSYYGVGGRGEMSESPEDGKPMITFNGFMYDFVLQSDGVLMPNQNGDGNGLNIHRNTFKRDETAKLAAWETDNWDGMWQNAVGETIVIDTANMIYTASSPDYSMDGTLGDEGEGMGLYLYDNDGRAYLCASEDGNSFTVSGEYPGRYSEDGHFDGVFYRDGDIAAYTDLENAKFYYGNGSDTWLWYNDGVNEYFLGDEYKLGDDGLAYYEADNKIYPAGWIPDEPYDPSVDWGENAQGETGMSSENDAQNGNTVNDTLNGGLNTDAGVDFSHFEGIWYYVGDLSAETYIVMDASGNWSYYQRAPGAEPAEMDCGTLTQDADAADIYYAESTMYDGVSHQVFVGDGDVFLWDEEGYYYLME